jgi:hypothetical protein
MATTLSQKRPTKEEILARYPIRNDVWLFVPKTGVIVIEMSVFQHGMISTDPWGRPLSTDIRNHWRKDWGDCEDDACITWCKTTTVAGVEFELVILND